jgi:hypothetical protein
MSDYKLYWGDTHTNIHSQHLQDLPRILEAAVQMLDFWPLAYYPQEFTERGKFSYEDWIPDEQIDREWQTICDFAADNNRPDTLVIYSGYEWQGHGRFGDHNVFHLEDHQPLLRSNTLPELYEELHSRKIKAFAIPHHTAYMVGVRAKRWDVHDDELSPFAEIYSCHGCSESDEEWLGLRTNWSMGPNVSGGTIEDGLDHGYRLGIICSGDTHHGFPGCYTHGLMGCYASALTREALWEAFAERRVYGVSADRIALDFRMEDAWMGAEITKSGPVRCSVSVCGGDAVDHIELLRNKRVIATYCHNGTWATPSGDERVRCKLRVEAGWGPGARHYGLTGVVRDWEGCIEIPDGIIRSVERCWMNFGQRVGEPGQSRCDFGFHTGEGKKREVPTEAVIFEIEGRPKDTLKLEIEGKKLALTLAEAMGKSQMIYFPEEVEAALKTNFGVNRSELPRDDPFYYLSHKVKVHRAIPEMGFTAEWEYTDDAPPAGKNVYRVRVHQRNGSVAWSSPVWVRND